LKDQLKGQLKDQLKNALKDRLAHKAATAQHSIGKAREKQLYARPAT
jgi:hypothetical protein